MCVFLYMIRTSNRPQDPSTPSGGAQRFWVGLREAGQDAQASGLGVHPLSTFLIPGEPVPHNYGLLYTNVMVYFVV